MNKREASLATETGPVGPEASRADRVEGYYYESMD